MVTTASAAAWFLPAVLPICLFVAWSDLRAMIIPNKAVMALVIAFAILGFVALPLTEYIWRWSHLAVMLVIGMVLNAARVMGAGDAKFIAAAAPFVALGDLTTMAMLLAVCLVVGLALHRLAMHSPLRRLVPDWKSWSSGRRFPMGFPLASSLTLYLLLALRG
jgi:prepilin peptidase CpaA